MTRVQFCPGCGAFHPGPDGQYQLVGSPAPGYAGQMLWVPGDPLD